MDILSATVPWKVNKIINILNYYRLVSGKNNSIVIARHNKIRDKLLYLSQRAFT